MCSLGVAATSIDRVLESAGAGKSQFYHYFETRDALVAEVVAEEAAALLSGLRTSLENPGGVEGIAHWLQGAVAASEEVGLRGGCPIGSMAAEVADRDPTLRARLAEVFEEERQALAAHLAEVQARGLIRLPESADSLAIEILAALQGGLLLGKTTRDPQLLRAPVDAIISRLAALTPSDDSKSSPT